MVLQQIKVTLRGCRHSEWRHLLADDKVLNVVLLRNLRESKQACRMLTFHPYFTPRDSRGPAWTQSILGLKENKRSTTTDSAFFLFFSDEQLASASFQKYVQFYWRYFRFYWQSFWSQSTTFKCRRRRWSDTRSSSPLFSAVQTSPEKTLQMKMPPRCGTVSVMTGALCRRSV